MCALILEWPNLVQTGIGNGSSEIDMSLLLNEPEPKITGEPLWCGQPASEPANGEESSGDSNDDGKYSIKWDIEDDTSMELVKEAEKREKIKVEKHIKKTAAHIVTSKPAGPQPSLIKPTNIMDRFAEVAKIKEETVQRQLELKSCS
jgi:hypothetical protein